MKINSYPKARHVDIIIICSLTYNIQEFDSITIAVEVYVATM